MNNLNPLTRGVIVLIILALATGLEYLVGTRPNAPVAILVAFGIFKAALVLYFFMHIMRVFRTDEGGHS